ncbi:MAG: ATP-binding cassette domain-containing protein [Deltaproteobacteria bacterium]|nr:ATP-binding cassette domain-containing protein [Deltaproteobacteria bacterium]
MIETRHLTKIFGLNTAVDDVSFSVDKGEVLGFLGPNAAGKSTTMRMITGFLPPTSGTVVVGGHDIVEDSLPARKMIGYLPENAPVYPDMTVTGFLDFVAGIRGFRGKNKGRRVEDTIKRCFLGDVRHQTVNTLSKGFKQRVCFAQSILPDPAYLVMDEPTDGLDPNQKHEVRAMIREMARDKAIILSTHNLDEVDAICTRAIIIAGGRILADDTPEKLKARSSLHGAVRFTVRKVGGEDLKRDLIDVRGVSDARILEETDSHITIRVYPEEKGVPPGEAVLSYFMDRRRPVEAFQVEEGRLDAVFRLVTTDDMGEDEP